MRDLLSWMMLTTDEAWLNHAARIRSNNTVTAQDVEMEDMLFECERLFKEMHARLAAVAPNTAAQPLKPAPIPAHMGVRAAKRP